MTRADAVLALLESRAPGWVEGHEIAAVDVGGSEGLRRVRELSKDHRIDRERIPGRDEWRYRLVPRGNPEGVQSTRDGMRPNSMPGRPDRYVDLSRSTALAIDQTRKQRQEEANAALLKTPYLKPGTIRISFGQSLCRSCKGTGGNLLDGPCSLCRGTGVEG